MKATIKLFSCLLFLAFVFTHASEDEVDDKDVHVLTAENFDSFVAKNNHSLIMFYAPWCGHCKSLKPHYAAAATQLKENTNVALGKVDATVESDLGTRFEIRGYPTLKWFSKDGTHTDYAGGRTTETIVSWIETMMGPAVTEMKESDLDAHKKAIIFVARVKKAGNKSAETFTKLAEKMRQSAKFGMIVSDSAKDEVTVYRPNDDPITISIGTDVDALEKWVKEEKFPFFGPIDGDTYAAYEERGKELVWFAGTNADYEKHAPEIRKAAKKFTDSYSFVWVDTERFGGYVESGLGISKIGLVLRLTEGGRYLYPEDQPFESKKIIEFFEDVKAGKVEKFLKSEPIPETNDEAVKVVVGKNFDDMVFEKEKDVMLEIYAPWCGHCKRLEPIYTELAEKLAHVKHVRIAKMDGTANEPSSQDFAFRGFPHIFWVKAGQKTPETYSGARTLEGLLTYIKENSSKPVDVAIPEKKEEGEEAAEDKDEL